MKAANPSLNKGWSSTLKTRMWVGLFIWLPPFAFKRPILHWWQILFNHPSGRPDGSCWMGSALGFFSYSRCNPLADVAWTIFQLDTRRFQERQEFHGIAVDKRDVLQIERDLLTDGFHTKDPLQLGKVLGLKSTTQ